MVYDLGKKLKEARLRAGLTQQEVANRLGLESNSTVSFYETSGSNPNAETLMKLATIYGVSADYLLGLVRQKALFTDGLTERQIDALQTVANAFRQDS